MMIKEYKEYSLGEYVYLIPTSGMQLNLENSVRLGSQGSIILWNELKKNQSEDAIILNLSKKYNVNSDRIKEDLKLLKNKLCYFGIVDHKKKKHNKITKTEKIYDVEDNGTLLIESKKYRVPIKAQIEITNKCNLNCIHCYNKNMKLNHMPFESFKKYLNQLNNLIYLNLTGGEITVHPEFYSIYKYAFEKKVRISLFSNGLYLDEYIDIFKKCTPHKIEISIYGMNNKQYELTTGVKDAYDKVIENINLLKRNNINILLKYILMNKNYEGFNQFISYAKENNFEYRFDGKIINNLEGTINNENLRLDIKKILHLEINQKDDIKNYYKNLDFKKTDKLFSCGAGLNSLFIDSFGNLKICAIDTFTKINLKNKKFISAWDELGNKINKTANGCNNCIYRKYCTACPALLFIESNKMDYPKYNEKSYYCRFAELKYDYLKSID